MTENQSFTFVLPDGQREPAMRRANPDGTVGGWVARSAKVHATAIIQPDAVVGPQVVVGSGCVVVNGQILSDA